MTKPSVNAAMSDTISYASTDVKPASINGCATAVLIDPASGNRIAGADRRRDCYAIAY